MASPHVVSGSAWISNRTPCFLKVTPVPYSNSQRIVELVRSNSDSSQQRGGSLAAPKCIHTTPAMIGTRLRKGSFCAGRHNQKNVKRSNSKHSQSQKRSWTNQCQSFFSLLFVLKTPPPSPSAKSKHRLLGGHTTILNTSIKIKITSSKKEHRSAC